jgi:anti-anti-sigma factor
MLTSTNQTLRLEGRFDAHAVGEFTQVAQQFSGDVQIDLSAVEFIDSSGLAAFVSLEERLHQRGHTLRLQHPQDAVRLIFEITKLDRVLPLEHED